jgi:nucleotide-binding universal stress UspA family protein
MITRILLAVDDSPAALAATRTAVELAAALGAQVRAVHVLRDHVLSNALLAATGRQDARERLDVAASSVLDHVARLARTAGVDLEPALVEGEPAHAILAQARAWPADLIVIGKSDQQRRAGAPYVGGETANVLEFAEQPVLVVAPPVGHR